MAPRITSISRRSVAQISKNRNMAPNSSVDCPGAHAAAWPSPDQHPPRGAELCFQSVDRVICEVADGLDQCGVVSQLRLSEFLQLQVVEIPNSFVDDTKVSVDAAHNDVIRQPLFKQHKNNYSSSSSNSSMSRPCCCCCCCIDSRQMIVNDTGCGKITQCTDMV